MVFNLRGRQRRQQSGEEEGGRVHRIRVGESQLCLILRPKTNDIPRPIHIYPTRLSVLFSRGGQVMIHSRSLLLALVLVVVLVPIRGKSRLHGRTMDGRRRNDQIGPPSSPPVLPTAAYVCTHRLWLALSICTNRFSVRLCHRPHHQAWIRHSFLRIPGRYLLPQARALRSIKLQLIQQDCTSSDTPMRLYLYLPSQGDLQYPHSLQFRSLWT